MKKTILYIILGILLIFIIAFIIFSKKNDKLKGKWIATPNNQNIYQINKNEYTGGNIDYILECDGKGKYVLTLENNNKKTGKYTVDNNQITFMDEKDLIVGICNLDKDEIKCSTLSTYAFKYERK